MRPGVQAASGFTGGAAYTEMLDAAEAWKVQADRRISHILYRQGLKIECVLLL